MPCSFSLKSDVLFWLTRGPGPDPQEEDDDDGDRPPSDLFDATEAIDARNAGRARKPSGEKFPSVFEDSPGTLSDEK